MEPKGKRGRWTKRSPQVEREILDALHNGSTQKDAAEAAGVTWETFHSWRKQDPDFLQAVARAEAECARTMAARIRQEATVSGGDWRAAMEWLKRRRREDWTERTELTGAQGAPLEVVVRFAEEGE